MTKVVRFVTGPLVAGKVVGGLPGTGFGGLDRTDRLGRGARPEFEHDWLCIPL